MINNINTIRGTYFYFKDLVDEKVEDYGKIAIIKAKNINEAWEELLKTHQDKYDKTSTLEQIKNSYEFLEKRDI